MLGELAKRYTLSVEQAYKLDYILKLFSITVTPEDLIEELLFLPLNDHTEELTANKYTLMLIIRNDSITGIRFEELASLGVEILIRDLNYANLRDRVKSAILD